MDPNEIEAAIKAVLDTSCASDGCGDTGALADVLTSVVADVAGGVEVRSAVEAHWELDDVERRELGWHE